jgi:anti-anti-sigma regulatory factor
MDSAGLDALLHCLGEVAQRDGTILLGEVSAEAVTVLELTRMDRLLEMFRRVSFEAEDLAASSPAQTDSQPQAVAA